MAARELEIGDAVNAYGLDGELVDFVGSVAVVQWVHGGGREYVCREALAHGHLNNSWQAHSKDYTR